MSKVANTGMNTYSRLTIIYALPRGTPLISACTFDF